MQQQQARAEDLRQANAPRSPSPIKASQEQEVLSPVFSPSPHSILPSPPGLPFPPHFYHPLMANPLYRLSPLLAQLNPLLLFRHNKSQMELVESQIKSQMEVVEEHRKLLLSFGISPGGKAAGEGTKEDWKDIDGEPDVKVEVDDDDIEEEDHHQEGNDDHDNDPVDLTFKSSDEEGLAAREYD